MSESTFYQFLDEKIKNIKDIIWFTSIIIHERYKYKYSLKCYDEDIWINKLDNSITNKDVKNSLINDIIILSNELLLYNETRQNKYITIISSKLNNNKFIKSIMRELRELFYIK